MELNKKNILRILALAVGIAVLWWIANNIASVGKLITTLFSIVSPLVLGLSIAYVLNLIMNPLENLWRKLFEKKEGGKVAPKLRRPVCLIVSFLLVLAAIAAIIFILVPNLVRTVQDMVNIISAYLADLDVKYDQLRAWLADYSITLPELKPAVDPDTGVVTTVDSILERVQEFLEETGQRSHK